MPPRLAEATVEPDYIEIGSFIAAAAATHGDISIEGVAHLPSLRIVERHFARLGVKFHRNADALSIASQKSLRVETDGGGAIPKIDDGPWPSFPSDLMSVAIVLATQARGGVLFFQRLQLGVERRQSFLPDPAQYQVLVLLGARVAAGEAAHERAHPSTVDTTATQANR